MNPRPVERTLRLSALLLLPALAGCGMMGTAAPSPEEAAHMAVEGITAEDVAREIGVLAHDSMAGRDTPSPELEATASYLADRFRAMGLEPAGENGGYMDRYDYTVTRMVEGEKVLAFAGVDEGQPAYGEDFFLVRGREPLVSEAVYLGVAGEASPGAEHAGKVVVMDHPVSQLGPQWQQTFMGALGPAMQNDAAALVMVMDSAFPDAAMQMILSQTEQQSAPLPIVGVTHDAAEALFAAAGHDLAELRAAAGPTALGTPVEVWWAQESTTHTPPNVAAMLPGSDPELRDTYVVITAHFDHVGIRSPDESGDSIYNGADDNASGTAAVVEMAEAFASLPEAPARSVIFVAVSGEEKGLLGAAAWVADPPGVDIANVVANVNLDMVGRLAPDTVIGIGQEYTTMQAVLEEIQAHHPELGLEVILDPVPEQRFFFRSDQLPFIRKGIPAVFFTNQDHEDYHRPSDEAEKIDNDKVARVARLGFLLAYHIAQDPVAPEWTEEGKAQVEEMLGRSPF